MTTFVKKIRLQAREARFLKDDFDKMPQGKERHEKYLRYEAIQTELYDEEFSLEKKFEPHLKFPNWKYGLIWPKKKKPIGLQIVKPKKNYYRELPNESRPDRGGS